ncbi:MAG: hypothetical protein NVS4B6_13540 [Mycobacterium sp.]
MRDTRKGLTSFTAVMVGFVLVLVSFLLLGLWLAAAGDHVTTAAIAAGVGFGVCLVSGVVILVLAVRHRGGLLRATPDRDEIDTYRDDYGH